MGGCLFQGIFRRKKSAWPPVLDLRTGCHTLYRIILQKGTSSVKGHFLQKPSRNTGGNCYRLAPKSVTRIWPVMARDSSLARKRRMFATSSAIQGCVRRLEWVAMAPNMS